MQSIADAVRLNACATVLCPSLAYYSIRTEGQNGVAEVWLGSCDVRKPPYGGREANPSTFHEGVWMCFLIPVAKRIRAAYAISA